MKVTECAVISSKTRESAESIGTSINTMLSRLSRITQTGFNEDDDTKLNDVAKALNTVGIALTDQTGNFRDFGVIIDEVAVKWDTLDDKTQSYIANTIGGVRQQSRFFNLMNGYAESMDLYEQSLESAGTAQSKFNLYLESNQATLDNFRTTLEGLWITIIDSDSLMNIVRAGTSFIELLDSMVQKFGLLGSALTVLIPLIGVKYVASITASTKATIASKLAGKALGNSSISLANGFKLLIGQLFGVKTAADGTAISFMGLNAAAGLLGVALVAIPVLITAIATAEEKRKKAMEESIEAFQKQQDINSSMEELISTYKELASKAQLTSEESQKLLDVKSKIKDLIPEATAAVDSENLSLAEQIELLEHLNAKELERLEQKAHEQLSRGNRAYEKEIEQIEEMTQKLEQWKLKQKELSQKDLAGTLSFDERFQYENITKQIQEQEKELDSLIESTQTYESARDFMTNGLKFTGDALTDIKNKANDANNAFDAMSQSAEALYKEVSDSVDAYDLFNQALKELNGEGRISKSTYEKLIELSDEFADIMGLEKDAAIALMNSHKTKSREVVENLIKEQEVVIETTEAKIAAYEAELMMMDELLRKRSKLAYLDEREGLVQIEGRTGGMSGLFDSTQTIGDWKRAIEDARNKISSLRGMGSFFDDSDKSGSKSSKASKKEYKAQADAYAKINLELDKNNILLQKNKTLQDLASDDLEEKLKLMAEEISLNEQRQKSLHDLNQLRRQEVLELEKSLATQGFVFEGEGDNRMIANLEKIQSKTKEVEEQFKRYIQLQKDEIPKASQEWWTLKDVIEKVSVDKLITEFELADQKLKKLTSSLSELEYGFKLLDEKDIDGKVENIGKQIENLEQQLSDAQAELISLGDVGEDAPKAIRDRFEELTKRIQDGTLAIKAQEDALVSMRESLRQQWVSDQNALQQEQQKRLSALDSIQEKLVAIIRKRGEEEKKILDDNHKAEMDSLEERHNERKKKYTEELDAFRKMIQDKIDALDEQYEEEDYLEQLNKEREQANELQKQIDVLSLDDSLTARNKTIELRKKLAEQNEKIAKMQQKKERDLLKKSLQDQLKDKEKDAKDKEDIADKTYENEKKRLEEDYKISKEFLDKKYSDEQVYAEARESIMRGQVEVAKGVFMDIYDAFEDFENKFGKGMGILGDIIKHDFTKQLEDARQAIRDLEYESRNLLPEYDSKYDPGDDALDWRDSPRNDRPSGGSGRPPEFESWSNSDYNQYIENKKAWEQATDDYGPNGRYDLANKNAFLRAKYWGVEKMHDDDYDWKDLINWRGYADGGKNTVTGLHMLHGTKTNPEWIFNDSQLKSIVRDVTMSAIRVAAPKIPNVASRQGITLQIDNFIKADNITKDSIPELKKIQVNAMQDLKNLLIKNGVRPSLI